MHIHHTGDRLRGLSEQQARERGIKYRSGKFQFAANGKALTMAETDGVVKVLVDEADVIIGVHIIGPHASDLIMEGLVLVEQGITRSQAIDMIHPHPTLSEALKEAILDAGGRPSPGTGQEITLFKGNGQMLQIINPSDDPYFNMAVEDYLVHNPDLNEDIFMLWQNRPTVVVGRHQNSHAEITWPGAAEGH